MYDNPKCKIYRLPSNESPVQVKDAWVFVEYSRGHKSKQIWTNYEG